MKWLRLAFADWRAPEYRIMLLAVALAVAAISAMQFVSDRVRAGMQEHATELIGADIVLQSARSLPIATWLANGKDSLPRTTSIELASMVSANDDFVLASVKAIGPGYPLRGALRLWDQTQTHQFVAPGIPAADEVWIEPRLLKQLQMKIGDTLDIGYGKFKITQLIAQEPDRAADFYSFAPRAMINLTALDITKLIAPGTRAKYRYYFKADSEAAARLKKTLSKQLAPQDKWLDFRDGRPSLGTTLDNAEKYLTAVGVLIWALAGVALFLAAERFYRQHAMHSAWLRCLGVTPATLLLYYASKLFALGLLGGSIGIAIGIGLQTLATTWLQGLMPLAVGCISAMPLLFGMLSALVLLAGFVLPKFVQLARLPATHVIRNQTERNWRSQLSAMSISWLVVAAFSFAILPDKKLILAVALGFPTVLVVVALITQIVLLGLARIIPSNWPLAHTAALLVKRQHWLSTLQCIGFIVTFSALGITYLIRTDLIASWQATLPAGTPNNFALNILPEQRDEVASLLAQHGVTNPALFPVVRARLTAIDGKDVQPKSDDTTGADESLRRELNLTWSQSFPADNRVTAGNDWNKVKAGERVVSVEAGLAKRLGLQLGDQLKFKVAEQEFDAKIYQFRSVEWGSFHPNFYFIFPPQVIEALPHTYMTSFYLPPTDTTTLITIIKRFPAMSVLPVGDIIRQIGDIVTQITTVIEWLLVMVLAASALILLSATWLTRDQRLSMQQLFAIFGVSREKLHALTINEFGMLAITSASVSVVLVESAVAALYALGFSMPIRLHPLEMSALFAFAVATISVTGRLANKTIHVDPTRIRSS